MMESLNQSLSPLKSNLPEVLPPIATRPVVNLSALKSSLFLEVSRILTLAVFPTWVVRAELEKSLMDKFSVPSVDLSSAVMMSKTNFPLRSTVPEPVRPPG